MTPGSPKPWARLYRRASPSLAISRHFCRMIGGDITMTSEFGRGSTFIMRVPVMVAALSEPAAR